MKAIKLFLAISMATAIATAIPAFADGGANNVLTNDNQRVSYAIGMMFAKRWKQQGVDVDNNLVMRGLNDVKAGGPTLLSEQEEQEIIVKFQRQIAQREQQTRQKALARNAKEAEEFLAKNKNQPGVVTLPDGLQYKIITEGTGDIPTSQDMVTVNFRGTFVNGTEFDSSARAGHPVQVPVARVVPGWSEALMRMKVGSKWQIFIPSDLAYGQTGYSTQIEPNKILIVEVELLSIEHPQNQAAAPKLPQQISSEVIKVPGANELKTGAKVEVLTPEQVKAMQQQQSK